MKKIIAILLSLALLLGCAAATAEESVEKENFGIIRANGVFTLKGILPEGYKIVPFEMSDDAILSWITCDDPTRPTMVMSIGFDETYADVERMNDLEVEDLEVLEKSFTLTDPYANISYEETAYGTRLMICRTVSDYTDYLDIISIYKGYFVEFVMMPGEGVPEQKLTDEEIETCIKFLSDMEFVSGEEKAELKTAGATFTCMIAGFDAEAKTIDAVLLTPVKLTEWEVVSVNEGDTIKIGSEEVEIGTLVYEGDDAIINDEYYLTKGEDGLYTAKLYESPVMEQAKELTLTVPDSLVFEDEIDGETGEILDEKKTQDADGLFAALAAAMEGGVSFDSQNVKITFDENDEPAVIERFYAPWQ